MASNSKSDRGRWLLMAAPILAAALVALVLAFTPGAGNPALADSGPKPACPGPDLAFPNAGCDQYSGTITYGAKVPNPVGDQTCTGSGELSEHRNALVPSGEFGDSSYTVDIFFAKFSSTCQPSGFQQSISVAPQSGGKCTGQLQYQSGPYACTINLNVDALTNSAGLLQFSLAVNCNNIMVDQGFNCSLPPATYPNLGGGITLNSLSIVLAPEAPPPPSLGGVAQYPDVSSGPNVALLAGVVAAATGGMLALGGAGWYVRRRSSS